jgi:hypothetical protein
MLPAVPEPGDWPQPVENTISATLCDLPGTPGRDFVLHGIPHAGEWP